MAQSELSLAAVPAVPRASPPIVVLYVREPDHPACALDEHLIRVVGRYQGVELRLVDPNELAVEYSFLADCSPSVLVLRDGVVIGSAIGDGLPQRELDDMLHAATRWPH
jgi:hypothetical protein